MEDTEMGSSIEPAPGMLHRAFRLLVYCRLQHAFAVITYRDKAAVAIDDLKVGAIRRL